MSRPRKSVLTLVLALAVLAGPVAVACADCCPSAVSERALAPAADCCGDCGATLERSPDPVSLAAAKASLDSPAAAVLAAAPACIGADAAARTSTLPAARHAAAPSAPPLPLRL